MTYLRHSLPLTQAIVNKLGSGLAHHFKTHELSGQHPVYLTAGQLKKLHMSHKTGKGFRLRMSHSQLRHNVRHARGFFDTLKGLAGKALGAIAPKARDALVGLAKDQIGKRFGSSYGDLASSVAGKAFDKLHGVVGAKLGGGKFQDLSYFPNYGGSFARGIHAGGFR